MQQRHGSGKTAVLVERIINKIINEKIDIDKMLVVTFTNAAAAEMRGRIMEAIYKYLDENPSDEHMQKQVILMGKSNICTIHSFCLDIIKNNFYEINVSPNFRIGNQAEIDLLKQEVLEDIFEEKYQNEDSKFLKLINTYTNYRNDDALKEIILKIYRFIGASPFPEEWLKEKVEELNLDENINKDFSETIWGKILLNELQENIYNYILQLKNIKNELDKYIELDKYSLTIKKDIQNLEELKCNLDLWDKAYNIISSIKWETWPRDKKVEIEAKEIAKEKRDNIKKKFNDIVKKILPYDSKQALYDLGQMHEIMLYISEIVLEFEKRYISAKREKNIVDFNDIEHFALQILLKKENGKYVETEVAKEYKNKFVEIAIDEYQDSNLIQEYILNSISKGNNIFMVGDVKQSIYKFRQARPELFIGKYETYKVKKEKATEDNLKIQLFKNFRSRENILDITNLVFESIMSKELGDITYNENEYLNLGADYEEVAKITNYAGKTELQILDLKDVEEDNLEDENDEENEEELNKAELENKVYEAKLVANRIQELIKSKYQVYDKKIGYRDITYKDIVILLRATKELAPIYEKEINNLNMPVFSDTGSGYLESIEIQTIMALLKIIDNPMQDIPLVCILRSPIGGFSDNDLIQIKIQGYKKEQAYYYETLLEAKEKDEKLCLKIEKFLEVLQSFRYKKEYLPLDELLWDIYINTGYYNYVGLMPNGGIRQSNLKILFEKAKEYESASFKGLFNFINFIDKLQMSNQDMDSAKEIGENEDVIRIMSIHKSKGLEFPVVFLCSTGKRFNFQDLNDNILLHQDMGFGPQYIDYERKIQYNTLAKVAIGYKAKIETISEEMRILYVALTRAKEKLIITGISKDLQKDIQKKQEFLNMYKTPAISSNILKNYKSYLDWMELVYLKNQETIQNIMELKSYTKEELMKKIKTNTKQENEVICNIRDKIQNKENEKLKELLNWKYKNINSINKTAKTSVTKIKEIQNEEVKVLFEDVNTYKTESLEKPKFLKENLEITKAEIGTIMHLCIQRMDEQQEYTKEKLLNEIEKLVQKEIITKNEAQNVNIEKLMNYTKSDLYKDLKMAKKIYKEKAFYINMNAKEIYNEDIEEKILVQGVIDLYYVDKNDNIILVDYKTDYVKNNEQELIDKYKKQLLIYKRALETALGKEVYKTYIYSLYLSKSIEIN